MQLEEKIVHHLHNLNSGLNTSQLRRLANSDARFGSALRLTTCWLIVKKNDLLETRLLVLNVESLLVVAILKSSLESIVKILRKIIRDFS